MSELSIISMSEADTAIIEGICRRFLQAAKATGLQKAKFARAVGLTSQQLSNIAKFRNPPSHEVIHRAIQEFGFTADWFYMGARVGFRDPTLADRLRAAEKDQPPGA